MGLRDAAAPGEYLSAHPPEPEPNSDEPAERAGGAISRSGDGEGSPPTCACPDAPEQARGQKGAGGRRSINVTRGTGTDDRHDIVYHQPDPVGVGAAGCRRIAPGIGPATRSTAIGTGGLRSLMNYMIF